MYLRQRSRSERHRVEVGKCLRDANSEFAGDDPFNLFIRERLDLVLQALEGVEIWTGQQVCARGKELAQFDESRTKSLEVFGEFFSRSSGTGFLGDLVRENAVFKSRCAD